MFGPRELDVGEPVEDSKLKGGQSYFVPAGKSLEVEIGGYTYRVGARGVFIPQCDFGTVKRTVTDSRKTTRSRVTAARTSPGMFVKASSVGGKKIPCQGGKSVTIFLHGHYRNG